MLNVLKSGFGVDLHTISSITNQNSYAQVVCLLRILKGHIVFLIQNIFWDKLSLSHSVSCCSLQLRFKINGRPYFYFIIIYFFCFPNNIIFSYVLSQYYFNQSFCQNYSLLLQFYFYFLQVTISRKIFCKIYQLQPSVIKKKKKPVHKEHTIDMTRSVAS